MKEKLDWHEKLCPGIKAEKERDLLNEWVSEQEDETDRRRGRMPIIPSRKLPDPGTLRCFSDSFLM